MVYREDDKEAVSDMSPVAGVPESSVGMILQRGGEEMVLEKARDRFTLSLASNTTFANNIPHLSHSPIPRTSLEEVIVDPAQLEEAMAIARQSEGVVFASHVYQLQDNAQSRIYLTHEITIQFTPELTEPEIEAIATEYSLATEKPILGIPNSFVYTLTPTSQENPIKIANRLVSHPSVLLAEANIIIRQESLYTPRDSLYSQQWYLHNQGNSSLLAPQSHIEAEKAWEMTRGVRSVVVAIADDAIDINHPDFQGEGKIVAPKDFKDQDFLPLPETTQESHGTACAGIAVAEETGTGIVGVAPGCALMPLRMTGYLDDTAIEDLFNWAIAHGASVISCSWGAASIRFPLSLRQKAVMTRAATQGRKGKGCVIVFAAGNANRPVSGTIYERNWDANTLYGPTEWLAGFAVHPDVITVSACTSLNRKSAYSNWGKHIAVCAPSNNAPPGIWMEKTGYTSTAPEISAYLPGIGILTTDQLGKFGYDTGNFTRDFGGTSSACPVVAGVAALMLSVNPDLTAAEVKQLLQQTADKIVDRDPDPQLGMRLGTYDHNGHSQWFGYGRVNAFKAVQKAQEGLSSALAISQYLEARNDQEIAIPDNDLQGAISPLTVTEIALIQDIQIRVVLEHEFLGDLEIKLKAPTGEVILLQGRTLGTKTQLETTYSLKTVPALKQLLNQSSKGIWQLWVIDSVPSDTGRLKAWALILGVRGS